MPNYREILTKAIIAKGYKAFSDERSIQVEEEISRSLGCWVINHKSDILREGNQVFVTGSYQVFLWYGFDHDTNCKLINQTFDFKDEVPGASAKDCGNYLDMNLPMANWLANRYLENTLYSIDDAEDLNEKHEIKKYVSKQPTCVYLNHEGKTIHFKVERAYSIDLIGETKLTIKVNENTKKEETDLDSQINTDYILEKKQK